MIEGQRWELNPGPLHEHTGMPCDGEGCQLCFLHYLLFGNTYVMDDPYPELSRVSWQRLIHVHPLDVTLLT